MMRRAVKQHGAVLHREVFKVWGEKDFIHSTKAARIAANGEWSVEGMKTDGAWFKTFEKNRVKINLSHDSMRSELKALLAELEDPERDAYVGWSKPKGEGGKPHYTASMSTVTALREAIKKVNLVGSKLNVRRSRPGPEDSRGLATEISLEGSNLTEGENAVLERALSAHGGYAPKVAHGIMIETGPADIQSGNLFDE